ncbi:hypothetical protein C8Q77DRAFT_1132966, partial [Trametes polyzona]
LSWYSLLCRPLLPALLSAVPPLTPSNGNTTLPRRRRLQQTISERGNWAPWRDCTYLAPRCGAAPSLPFLRYDHRSMCWIDASRRTWLGSPSGTRGVARSTVNPCGTVGDSVLPSPLACADTTAVALVAPRTPVNRVPKRGRASSLPVRPCRLLARATHTHTHTEQCRRTTGGHGTCTTPRQVRLVHSCACPEAALAIRDPRWHGPTCVSDGASQAVRGAVSSRARSRPRLPPRSRPTGTTYAGS